MFHWFFLSAQSFKTPRFNSIFFLFRNENIATKDWLFAKEKYCSWLKSSLLFLTRMGSSKKIKTPWSFYWLNASEWNVRKCYWFIYLFFTMFHIVNKLSQKQVNTLKNTYGFSVIFLSCFIMQLSNMQASKEIEMQVQISLETWSLFLIHAA